MPTMQGQKRIAIVGSGCSGIAALWALKSTGCEIHLYEADERLGGHTNTVDFRYRDKTTKVDTGFIVMNTATYPNFIAFLNHIGIKPVDTAMTFGISRDEGLFEWAGTSLSAVFAQRSNFFRPRMWRMIFDIIRFNHFALDLLSKCEESETDPSKANGFESAPQQPKNEQSIGEYLDQEGYSEAFRNDYLIPMTAAVWSTAPDKASLEFPAITLIRFLWNHHLLNTVTARPKWMTILGGSQPYIHAVIKDVPDYCIHRKAQVRSLRVLSDGRVAVKSADFEAVYDHVILATHGNQALDIIREVATPTEKKVLSGFKTSPNLAMLHSDLSLMPKRKIAWSSWNYMTRTPSPSNPQNPTVCLTYNMNILQHIPRSTYGDVLVTLNPMPPPHPSLVHGTWVYEHPQYNAEAIRCQKMLPMIQNKRGISYCGAWTKYGFHEDGFSSGLKVAVEHLGAELPFEFVDSTFSRGRRPVLGWRDYVVRILVLVVQMFIVGAELAMMRVGLVVSPGKRRMKVA
ncbi:MAG: hypothetical protein LQ343_003482 [Gyalolechia ehrenbergii]|nr:MAG: hypothetical protein LQ343_003482 [Gyalolechia ehrenbergii]